MASSQQVRGANKFSDKEKAAIDKAVKEAQSVLANNIKNAKASQDQLLLVTGVMKNLQPREIGLQKSYEWQGKFLAKPSPIIVDSGAFVHEGLPPMIRPLPVVLGSKGAVIYGHNDEAIPKLGWLLAWDKSVTLNDDKTDKKFDKVYVEAGYLTRLLNMPESEIRDKLDASSNVSHYWDSETSAAAAAQMTDHAGNLSLVGAAFDVIMAPLPPQ